MKSSQYLAELRGLSAEALAERIQAIRIELDRARISAGFGQAKNQHAVRTLRQQLAQALTVRSSAARDSKETK